MSVSHSGAARREKFENNPEAGSIAVARDQPRLVFNEASSKTAHTEGFSVVDLGKSSRVSLMLTPRGRGTFRRQAEEVLAGIEAVLQKNPRKMMVTSQTVFLRNGADKAACEAILTQHYGKQAPL